MQKFFGRWLLLLLAIPATLAWLYQDLSPDRVPAAFLKISVVVALLAAGVLAISYFEFRDWSRRVRTLQDFVAALPVLEADLREDGPPEIQRLSRALRLKAREVRHLVDRANIEVDRREAILRCMAEGVLAVDAELKIIFCNDAFASTFSARTADSEGRQLYEVVREPLLREILERVLATGTAERDRIQLPTAGRRWFEARTIPLGAAPPRGAVIALHDITELHRQEQVRKDFVADVSHELRTPLSAIRGYAETLLDGALEDPGTSRKFVEVILSHAIRLGNIASDLLVLSELDSDSGPPADPQVVQLQHVIESAIHTVEDSARMRNVKVTHVAGEACFVLGLRFRLEQAVVNLLDNAVKFNRPDGEVRIECGYADDTHVHLTVADTGIGIPSGDLKRIFERFYRVDKARSRPAGGTGLGLPIVKEVVERMGGSVSVESVLGRGSKFTIELEAAPAPAEV